MYELTREQEILVKMVREFSEKEIAPNAQELDITGEFPADITKKMAELDLLGLNVPVEYGGAPMNEGQQGTGHHRGSPNLLQHR